MDTPLDTSDPIAAIYDAINKLGEPLTPAMLLTFLNDPVLASIPDATKLDIAGLATTWSSEELQVLRQIITDKTVWDIDIPLPITAPITEEEEFAAARTEAELAKQLTLELNVSRAEPDPPIQPSTPAQSMTDLLLSFMTEGDKKDCFSLIVDSLSLTKDQAMDYGEFVAGLDEPLTLTGLLDLFNNPLLTPPLPDEVKIEMASKLVIWSATDLIKLLISIKDEAKRSDCFFRFIETIPLEDLRQDHNAEKLINQFTHFYLSLHVDNCLEDILGGRSWE